MPDYGQRRIFDRRGNFRYPKSTTLRQGERRRAKGVTEGLHYSLFADESIGVSETFAKIDPLTFTESIGVAEAAVTTTWEPYTPGIVQFTAPLQLVTFEAQGQWSFVAPPQTTTFTAPADSERTTFTAPKQGE